MRYPALPVPDPAAPVAQMTTGTLARYRLELERRLRACPQDATRRDALRAALAGVLAEDAERKRISRVYGTPDGSGRSPTHRTARCGLPGI